MRITKYNASFKYLLLFREMDKEEMKIFIDSAQIEEIEKAREWGVLDGVTTNPTLIKKAIDMIKKKEKKIDIESYIKNILKAVKGAPVSLEVIGTDFSEMLKEGRRLYKLFNPIAHNVFIKIPVNTCLETACSREADGILAIKELTREGIPVNCTLVFTPEQALLAARAGAKIVSPFVGREDDYVRELNKVKYKKEDYFPAEGIQKLRKWKDDNGIVSGIELIKEIKALFVVQGVKGCEILAASIRNVRQFREAALAGADIATLPLSIIQKLLEHKKTREGMRQFVKDAPQEYAQLVGFKKTRGRR